MSRLPLAALFAFTLGCDRDAEPEPPAPAPFSDCDPLDEGLCAAPWPNSFFMKEDPTTATGYRLDLKAETLPGNIDGVQLDPSYWNEKDGFSTTGTILTYFREVDTSLLVSHLDIGAYLDEDVTIALIDVETGERVPYFAELDASAEVDRERLLLIYPAVPLRHNARYVVGVRGLQAADGSGYDISPAFLALRDGSYHESYDVEGRRAHYDEVVFPALEAQGFARDELQLAWDFVTISRESSLGRMEFMRDDAAERVGASGPPYTITSVEDEECTSGRTIGRTVYGTFNAPMYTETDNAGTLLTRDDAGMPYYNGESTADFMVRIPCSLIEDPRPSMILQYGHGLLGGHTEARTGYLSQMANDYGWVVIATDWKGMADFDRGEITLMLAVDPSGFAMIPERSLQGFLEQDQLLRLARGALAEDENLVIDGVSVIDPERFVYYGNSQGGILGAGYLGMSTQLERGVLGVPGAPYSLLLQRSADFDPFFLIFRAKFDDAREISFLISAFQTLWDPAEGAGWLWAMNAEPGEGQPAKQVLLQAGIGDAQVTTLGAQFMARAYGASTVAPQTRPIWGVEEREAPFEGSAIVEWYYPDGSEEPVENTPPATSGDTHECPRREPAAQQQLRDFVETGVINQYCDGVCEGLRSETCD